jgi:glutamine amidotransferase
MSIAIVDYGSGNLRSAAKAFERVVHESGQARTVAVTAEPEVVASADHVVLPGVGAFADCRAGINTILGMTAALEEVVTGRGRPFLGICVGMQLMASTGLENGRHRGFGWIDGEVDRLWPTAAHLGEATGIEDKEESAACRTLGGRLPHMGWNQLVLDQPLHPVLAGIAGGDHAYFVHSFGFRCADPGHVLAHAEYGGAITAAIGRDNVVGTQFHPEKSQATGLRLIANFLRWRP